MSQQTTLIYIAGRIDEAEIVMQMLKERDIPAVLENEALQGALGGLPLGETTSPQVRVPAEHAEKAREVVEAFEYRQRQTPSPGSDPVQAENDEWTWDDWPCCVECRRRRQTECPMCHTAGVNFAIAEYGSPDPDHGHTPWLMCDTCSEAFEPEFYRKCAWCGHEAEDGIDPPGGTVEREPISTQAMVVMIGLISLAFALGAYFWWITK